MKKFIIKILLGIIILIFIFGLSFVVYAYFKVNHNPYISQEDLFQKTGLTIKDFDKVNISDFVEWYDITEDNVQSLNIKELLTEYKLDNKGNMEYLINNDKQKGDLPDMTVNDIRYILFMSNEGMDTHTLLFDFERNIVYYSEGPYILNRIESDISVNRIDINLTDEQYVFDLTRKHIKKWESRIFMNPFEYVNQPFIMDGNVSWSLVIETKDLKLYRNGSSNVGKKDFYKFKDEIWSWIESNKNYSVAVD